MATTPVPGRRAADGPLVLEVEDEQAIAIAVARRLSAEGMRVHAVGDGQAGVDAATRLRPDLVVLDVMLPGIDGLEVCRRIQADRPVPVLMLTARDDETDMLVGLGVGVLSTAVPYALDQFVLTLITRARFALLLALLPATAAGIGAVMLQQWPTPTELAGIALVMTALVISAEGSVAEHTGN